MVSSSWWSIFDIKLNKFIEFLRYKNGILQETKNLSQKAKASSKKPRPKLFIGEEKTFGKGLYIFHIKKAFSKIYKGSHGENPETYTQFSDTVFAFQIGKDDFCDNYNG